MRPEDRGIKESCCRAARTRHRRKGWLRMGGVKRGGGGGGGGMCKNFQSLEARTKKSILEHGPV